MGGGGVCRASTYVGAKDFDRRGHVFIYLILCARTRLLMIFSGWKNIKTDVVDFMCELKESKIHKESLLQYQVHKEEI